MAASIDINELLEPIAPDAPAGAALTYDPVYDRIREARREDDAALPQGIWQTELKKADWGRVRELCIDALRTRSKDLQVAVWLTEALTQQEGFAGLRHGLEVILALSERYWEELHPLPEGGDLEFRMAPLVWLNEKMGVRVRTLPITRPMTGDARAYSFADLESAQRLQNLVRKNPRAIKEAGEGAVTLADFNASAMLTADEFYRVASRDIAGCALVMDRLDAFLRLRCGEEEGASFGRVRRALEEVGNMVQGVLRDRRGGADEEVIADDAVTGQDAPAASPVGNGVTVRFSYESTEGMAMDDTTNAAETPGARSGITIRSRDEAYSILASVADYLMRVEPHSPAPYLVKRAVTWGGMPLAALLTELVGDERNLVNIYTMLGINDGGG